MLKVRPNMTRLDRKNSLLVVIDVQEKLAALIDEQEAMQKNIERLIGGCHLLGVPAIVTEQYPKGLGSTTERLQSSLRETYGSKAIQKMCFSAGGSEEFMSALRSSGRRQVLICGIETHVCVYQTVKDLLEAKFEITLITDAVSSRTASNRDVAIHRMERDGAKLSTTEMALFELTVNAGTEEFKAISRLVK